jgi:CheY-like chemotaxis protein
MEAVGRLAGGVAHDFNNLLTIINGYAELALISTDMSSPVFAPLSEIRRAGEQAAELTQRLLAVGRSQVLQPRVVEMNTLVGELIAMVHPLLSGSIAVVSSLDPDAGSVRVDPGQLRQALLNLVMNAKDAMPDGGSLLIETTSLSADIAGAAMGGNGPVEYVTVSVTDTGIGMDESTRAHLFEPFFTTKGPGKGNGLGLSTTFGIVKQSGGHIQVRSELGDGATFKLLFPRCAAEAQPIASSSPRVNALAADEMRGRETVLVVEDDASLRGLISGSLGLLGYTVLEARNPAEAESVGRQHAGTIDLLLVDAQIPGVAPQDLAENIHRVRPGIRVLYMSGYAGGGMPGGSRLPDVGGEYILKPFSPHCLARKLREILGTSAPQIRPLCLVVDDEEPVRRLLARILVEAGYEVIQASDGAEAIEMVRQRAPGIVITDLVMPQKEGLETISEVRQLAPHAKIIAISGAFGSRFLTVATHLGANATLAKPISADVLLRTIRDILSSD